MSGVSETKAVGAGADSSATQGACIYLVNQISGHGHLDMYARLYSKALLEWGYRVVLISQHDPGMREWIAAHDEKLAERFTFYTRDDLSPRSPALPTLQQMRAGHTAPPPPSPRLLERAATLARRAYANLPQALRMPADKIAARANALSRRVHGALSARLPTEPDAAWRAMRADGVIEILRDAANPTRHHPLPFGVPFGGLSGDIREAAYRSGEQPDLIMFLYLDMMCQDRQSCIDLEEMGAPWAGIRFHPNGSYASGKFRPERYFLCPNARGAIFLNPEPIAAYHQRFPHLHFATFPDVTDATTLPEPSDLVRNVRARAGKRKIVLQLGTLSAHKGIFDLIALVKRADPARFFFAIIGEIFWSHYGDREQELRDFLENPPGNCFVRLGYLEDERELNSMIQASDILYAVYKNDFRNSSNTITKASVFERPVLVSDRFLMGQRVRDYRVGEAVRAGDIEDTLFWLEEVAARGKERFGFEAYRRDHSIAALNEALARALPLWLAPQPEAAQAGEQSAAAQRAPKALQREALP